MKNFLFVLIILTSSLSFSQIENSNRRIDIAPPKTKTILPNVTLVNPNAFTFKKEEKKRFTKGYDESEQPIFSQPR